MFPPLLPAQSTTWTNCPFPHGACMHELFKRVLAYVMEVRSGLNKRRINARCSSNNRRDKTTRNYNLLKSIVELIPGDACWTEVNPFQGERKIDSRWDEEDYEIARQVANGLHPRMRRRVPAVKRRHPTKTDSSKWPPFVVYLRPCVKTSVPTLT